jgi:CRP-like cAMP-binding protein
MKLIDPDNPKKIAWEFFILVLTVLCTFILPLTVVFKKESTNGIVIFDILTTLFFSMDIFLNFHTTFEKKRHLVTNKKQISQRYLRGWFFWDLLATIPFALIFAGIPGLVLSRLFRIFRLTRLFKLFSSSRTLKRINEINNLINPSVIRMILMVFWVFVVAHLVSCFWISLGGIAPHQSPEDTYLQAFYWTITTLTTIGYGDISPDLAIRSQVIFTIITQLLGAGMYGFIIGNISNLLANMDIAKSAHKEKVERINTFLKYKSIPAPLQRRVSNYYDYLWESRRGYNEAAVIAELPHSLKTQITIQMNKELIQKVPLFEHAPDSFLKEVILNLEPVIFTPGDYIMEAGEMGYEMYFISSGKVDVLSADEAITYATLTGGAFIGEMALLLSTPRTATVKAVEYCDLYRLTKDMVDSILPRYPDIAHTMSREAERRRKENEEKKDHSTHTDEVTPTEGEKEEVLISSADLKTLPMIKEVEFTRVEGEFIVKMRWEEMADVNYYQVLKKSPRGEKWAFASSQLYSNDFIDLHPLKSERNIYRLRAVNENGPGPWSRGFYFSFEEGVGTD